MKQVEQTKFLGEEKISKLLTKLSLPAIIGMMVNALYNLTDTIFIGQGVGSLGIAGVSIALPIQMIVMSIALTIGIGGASIISRSLGQNNKEKAELTMGNAFILTALINTFTATIGLIWTEPILKLFGANTEIMPYALAYTKIILFSLPFFSLGMVGSNIIRAEGNAKAAMFMMILSAGLNIILDPIFILFFHWGVVGAALATAISQFVAFLYVFIHFLRGKSILKISKNIFKINKLISKEIFTIGSSSFARQISASVMAVIINNSLKYYGGSLEIAVFGVINRLSMFTLMPLFGIIQGMQPIVGYNYGAKLFQRVKETINKTILATSLMSTLAFLLLLLFAENITALFGNNTELITSTGYAIRIFILFWPTIGFQIVIGGMYQALGKAKQAIIISTLRQTLLLIPLIIILPIFFQLNGIWYAFPIADGIAVIATYFFYKHEMRSLTNQIEKEKSLI